MMIAAGSGVLILLLIAVLLEMRSQRRKYYNKDE